MHGRACTRTYMTDTMRLRDMFVHMQYTAHTHTHIDAPRHSHNYSPHKHNLLLNQMMNTVHKHVLHQTIISNILPTSGQHTTQSANVSQSQRRKKWFPSWHKDINTQKHMLEKEKGGETPKKKYRVFSCAPILTPTQIPVWNSNAAVHLSAVMLDTRTRRRENPQLYSFYWVELTWILGYDSLNYYCWRAFLSGHCSFLFCFFVAVVL